MYDFTQFANDFGSAALAVSATIGYLVKKGVINFSKVKEAAVAVEHVVEDVAKTPAGKLVEAELHHKLDSAIDELKDSKLSTMAAIAIIAIKKVVADMSNNEKVAVIALIKSKLPPNVKVSDADILKALEDAQKFAEQFGADEAIKKAQEYDQILQEITVPKQEAVQTQQTPA